MTAYARPYRFNVAACADKLVARLCWEGEECSGRGNPFTGLMKLVLSHALSPQKLRDLSAFPHTWGDSSLPPSFHGLAPSCQGEKIPFLPSVPLSDHLQAGGGRTRRGAWGPGHVPAGEEQAS